jgi:hypothetical protein
MIQHIVLFNLKPELDGADREWLFEQLHGLARIASVKSLTLNRLLDPKEDWYKPRLWTDWSWALTMQFENEDGLYAFQTDPHHLGIAQEIRKRLSTVKVMDFVALKDQTP